MILIFVTNILLMLSFQKTIEMDDENNNDKKYLSKFGFYGQIVII